MGGRYIGEEINLLMQGIYVKGFNYDGRERGE